MDQKTKKLIIVLLTSIMLATFAYVKFIKENDDDKNFNRMGNYADLEKGKKSKTSIYQDKRKAELAKIAEDRKVSSLESFLQDEIVTDPTKDSVAENSNTSIDTASSQTKEEVKSTKPKVIIHYVERPKKVIQPDPEPEQTEPVQQVEKVPRRKAGFSSVTTGKKNKGAVASDGSTLEIPVVLQSDTKVKSGTNVFFRTTEAVVIDGVEIPMNTLITGKASVGSNRLLINVTSFNSGKKLITKKLTAYSSDGSKGIEVQGGVDNAVKNDAVNDAISTVQRSVAIPVLKDIPIKAGKKIVNDPSVDLYKGHTLYLRIDE